jgi:ferrochelatase
MRHTAPWVAEGLDEALAQGDGRVVVVVLASHQSSRATGGYHTDIQEAVEARSKRGESPGSLAFVSPWHTSVGYLDAVADRVRTALAELPAGETDSTLVLFSAHSLPLVRGKGDPEYERALFDTARGVMTRLPDHAWRVAYQSRSGRPGTEWLGPGVEDVLAEEAGHGRHRVVVVPLGFVVEHLETLYDLDMALKAESERLGMRMTRAGTVRDHPAFVAALAAAAEKAAVESGWEGAPREEAE